MDREKLYFILLNKNARSAAKIERTIMQKTLVAFQIESTKNEAVLGFS